MQFEKDYLDYFYSVKEAMGLQINLADPVNPEPGPNPEPPTPQIEMVDLGLSVKWAKYNLGATHNDTADSWYGNYYQWGSAEVANEKTCKWEDCPYTNGVYSKNNKKVFTKYIPTEKEETYWSGSGSADNKLVLDAMDDPATLLGGNLHMPTEAELQELLDTTKVTSVWVSDYNGISGLNGIEFTSLINGNTLFIPASGSRSNDSITNTGSYCYMWSSSIDSSSPIAAKYLCLCSNSVYVIGDRRYFGFTVRPVRSAS